SRSPSATGKSAGSTCSTDSDCRSGTCGGGPPKICVDTCCSDTDCKGNSCSAAIFDGHGGFACTVLDATLGAPGENCTDVTDRNYLCQSDYCKNGTCRPHCCNFAACPAAEAYGVCQYATLTASDVGSLCAYPGTTPAGSTTGATCAQERDCKS